MIRELLTLVRRTPRGIADSVDAELRFHLDERTDALIAQGLDATVARAQALREFGDVESARRSINAIDLDIESARRRKDYVADLTQDVVYAVRKLRASPTFAITAILTLAVGIGANTAVLNLINAVLLKPPAVASPATLAWVTPREPGGRYGQWSLPDYVAFRAAAGSFSGVAASGTMELTLAGDEPVRVAGEVVSANYFDVLGLRIAPGRTFIAREDTTITGTTPAIIGHRLWVNRFNADPAVIGRTVVVNTHPVTIIGVTPEQFNGMRIGNAPDMYLPMGAISTVYANRQQLFTGAGSYWLRVVARLTPEASHETATAEAAVLSARLEPRVTEVGRRRTVGVAPVRGGIDPTSGNKNIASILQLVMLVPLLVLGVACANVANLFMARSVQREKEIAVRRALGASRGRLVRQLITECIVLGLTAGAAGMLVSYALTAVIVRVGALPPEVSAILSPDLRVLVLTVLLAIVAGVLFGLVPALAATRNAITPSLKNDGIAQAAGGARHRLRNAFVVSQVALSLALLITAGLFVGSLRKALTAEPGFDPRNGISVAFDLAAQGYDTTRARAFAAQLVARITAEPGVEAAAMADVLPLSGSAIRTSVVREDAPSEGPGVNTFFATVSEGYFTTLRIPLARGRTFGAEDHGSSVRIAVVNERFGEVLWPGEDPLGKRFRPRGDSTVYAVVGVMKNGKYRNLTEQSDPHYWVPAAQRPPAMWSMLVVRSRGGTEAAVQAARRVIPALDPAIPLFRMATLESAVAATVDGQRAGAGMLGVFGVLALALAALGIFGVISHGVTTRTREIGIRMSLGAQASDVVRSFVREGLGLTLIGAVIGAAISVAASKLLASLLFGLSATDALTFVAAGVVLSAVATVASVVPARRAARVDPLIALRSD